MNEEIINCNQAENATEQLWCKIERMRPWERNESEEEGQWLCPPSQLPSEYFVSRAHSIPLITT
jgi:hypothetical protein